MSKYSCQLALAVSLCITLPSIAQQREQSSADLAMKLFMSACVGSQGHQELVEKAAKGMRLTELGAEDAKRFYEGNPGRVWATGDAQGQFALGTSDSNTCTVFVKRVGQAALRNAFQSWLPPKNSSFAVTTQQDDDIADIKTTSYAISRDGRLVASWVIRTSDRTDIQHQGVVSVRAAVEQ